MTDTIVVVHRIHTEMVLPFVLVVAVCLFVGLMIASAIGGRKR